jgi:hypothetical protein
MVASRCDTVDRALPLASRAQPRCVTDSGYVDKPTEFVAFAEKIRRWVRRWCDKRDDLMLAPSMLPLRSRACGTEGFSG